MMNKTDYTDLAFFGGQKLFTKPRPIGQLFAPQKDTYLDLIKKISFSGLDDETNDFNAQLEEKLKIHHSVRHCITVTNASVGIIMLMQIFSQGRKGEVIIPSFSYRGLPHFTQWAGQMPHFCDIDPISHCLDPIQVEKAINHNTTSILNVCNFNHTGHIDELESLGDKYDIPVFMDSVNGFGSSYQGKILGGFTQAEVYSTHATKLLNGFEGGYITTDDDDLADIIRWQKDYAYQENRPVQAKQSTHIIGLNGHLNEFHAAMALLSLEHIDEIISENKKRFFSYDRVIRTIPGLSLIPYSDSFNEKRNYQMVALAVDDEWPLTRDETLSILRKEGLAISPYYNPPLHLSDHCPEGITIPELPVTESLSQRFILLPVGEFVSVSDIKKITDLLELIYSNGKVISQKFHQKVTP